MRTFASWSAVDYGTLLLAMVVLGLSNMGAVDGAEAIYLFGDSFLDTGNFATAVMRLPYGNVWPGHPAGRWSDGRNIADYFAELFALPSPPPYLQLTNDSWPLQGVNFARSGAGVTYAFGVLTLDAQVDEMEALVQKGVLTPAHLRKSVTVINIGVNDYDARNFEAPFRVSAFYGVQELQTTVAAVVNGIALNVVRLHGLGIRNIVVTNLPLMVCTPLSTFELAYTACSTNSTLLNQTSIHNSLLQQRVRALNRQLRGVHVVIADQTKAFDQLFHHGADYGFVNALTPCCHGKNSDLYSLACGNSDSEGNPIYVVCQDPRKAVLFDTIHPTQAASKVVVNLYASVPGYTLEGPMLNTWIRKYNV